MERGNLEDGPDFRPRKKSSGNAQNFLALNLRSDKFISNMNRKSFLTALCIVFAMTSILMNTAQARRGSGVVVIPPPTPTVAPPVSPQ